MELFYQRALSILRLCMGGPPPGHAFLTVLVVALLAYVVTLEHVGLIVGMKRYSGLRAWFTGLVSYSALLAAGTYAHGYALARGMEPAHAQVLAVVSAICVGLLVVVPLLALTISVSYLGGVCALGLGILSSLIVGKVATESLRSFRAASEGREIKYVEAKGLGELWRD